MREIKFRYWCKLENKMYDKAYIEEHLNLAFMSELLEAAQKRYVFQQFTGLKVNGDEPLFEGDIVPVTVPLHNGWKQGWEYYKRNAVVEYVAKEMRFMLVAFVEGQGIQYVPFDKSIRQSYKIIGNIYENPELLEQVK